MGEGEVSNVSNVRRSRKTAGIIVSLERFESQFFLDEGMTYFQVLIWNGQTYVEECFLFLCVSLLENPICDVSLHHNLRTSGCAPLSMSGIEFYPQPAFVSITVTIFIIIITTEIIILFQHELSTRYLILHSTEKFMIREEKLLCP